VITRDSGGFLGLQDVENVLRRYPNLGSEPTAREAARREIDGLMAHR